MAGGQSAALCFCVRLLVRLLRRVAPRLLCPAVFFVLDRARACALQSSAGLLCAQLLCYARAAPRGVRCAASEAEVRALAATLKKGPAASASARTATAGGGASGAGASGAGARGTAPPIDDGISNKNIEVCFSITHKERGKKEVTGNFWCAGTIESANDESTVLEHCPQEFRGFKREISEVRTSIRKCSRYVPRVALRCGWA